MKQDSVFYIGVDVSKAKHAIAVAEGGRHGEVRYFGEIEAPPAAVERLVRKLEKKHPHLHFCYEAGPTGYGLYRQIVELGHRCDVVAPSLIPKRAGERVKTNRRDAVSLARLLRAGELKGIWVPDAVHEAVRDLVRVRAAASEDLRKKRQMLLSFLLRHGRVFTGRKNWSRAYACWLAAQKFDHPAQQIVFQDQVDVITDAQNRLERLDGQLAELAPSWSMAPVAAYQALRGVSFVVAVTFVSEVGDVRRFDNPRQLMAFLGLVPSERSTGDTVKRGGLTLAGNRRARRVLVEGAWSYRHPARVTEPIRVRLEGLPKAVREIAWKAQTRLCARYRRMMAAGKKKPIVIAAIAREMAAFLWAIGHQVEPVN
ncbi:IS110 family transposase [Mesorhizobium sp.]|uniref:IS110 family transposase n=1 Tax=Mesorhizobium sp. TaxID=1871066 RepID=UPI000FE60E95|nr:IS110 family transposase [Mesorhizobium sp.]RWO20266.1 MAG: IS110 family transposase [Mesorhizobium sp.]